MVVPLSTDNAKGRARFVFIFVTVALDMLAVGIIIPILPKLIEQFESGNTGNAAQIYGLFSTAWALMQFAFSPTLGAISDCYGRRSVILLSNFGLGLSYLVMAVAPTLSWLFLARILSGITSASFPAAGAYVADITPPEQRAKNYGMLSAAFGLGFVLGPALGGIAGSVDPRLPFWLAAGLSLINATYGILVLPESLSPDRRGKFQWRRANPMGSLGLLRSDSQLFGLATVRFIGNIAFQAMPTTFVLYASYRFGWGESAIGLALAASGICSALVGTVLVQPSVARFGERRVLLGGLIFAIAGYAIYGLATTTATFLTAIPVGALGGLSSPTIQGMMTRRVRPSEQGQLQGALNSMVGIASMIGPIIFAQVFASFIGEWRTWNLPGAPFVLGAIMLALSLLVAWRSIGISPHEIVETARV